MTTTTSRAQVSATGRDVLRLLARASAGSLPLSSLRTALQRPGVSVAVQRASLSRTLRRLWRAGLVELTDGRGEALTARVAAIQRWAQRVETDPVGAYRIYVTQASQADRFGSAEAYAQAYREHAQRLPEIRVSSVMLTPRGAALG